MLCSRLETAIKPYRGPEMGAQSKTWHLSWSFPSSCVERGSGLEPQVSPQYHVVFDDEFTTVPHLRKGTVPKNWADLVENTRERTTEEFYDLSKTWFEPVVDPTAEDNEHIVTVDSRTGTPSVGSDHTAVTPRSSGDGRPRPQLPIITQDDGVEDVPSPPALDSEGEAQSLPNVAASEGGFGLPSEGDADDLFMPEMVNLETSGQRR